MTTLTYQGELVMRTCWCGIRHAIPEELSRSADRDKSTSVYCPLGHPFVVPPGFALTFGLLAGLGSTAKYLLSVAWDECEAVLP